MLDTWNLNRLESKVLMLRETEGRKAHKSNDKGSENMTDRDPGHNIAT